MVIITFRSWWILKHTSLSISMNITGTKQITSGMPFKVERKYFIDSQIVATLVKIMKPFSLSIEIFNISFSKYTTVWIEMADPINHCTCSSLFYQCIFEGLPMVHNYLQRSFHRCTYLLKKLARSVGQITQRYGQVLKIRCMWPNTIFNHYNGRTH